MSKALFVTFEGIDGSGKETQAKLLAEKYSQNWPKPTMSVLSFPRYAQHWGRFVRRYLDGELGNVNSNHPLLVSLLYTLDRVEARDSLQLGLDRELLICDRYVDSNVAHQAAKLSGSARYDLMEQIFDHEYNRFSLPVPDMTIYLNLPVAVAMQRKKGQTPNPDIHEVNRGYLADVARCYDYLAQPSSLPDINRQPWHVVDCMEDGDTRTSKDIAAEVFSIVHMALLNKRTV